jgi:hypothetical protein
MDLTNAGAPHLTGTRPPARPDRCRRAAAASDRSARRPAEPCIRGRTGIMAPTPTVSECAELEHVCAPVGATATQPRAPPLPQLASQDHRHALPKPRAALRRRIASTLRGRARASDSGRDDRTPASTSPRDFVRSRGVSLRAESALQRARGTRRRMLRSRTSWGIPRRRRARGAASARPPAAPPRCREPLRSHTRRGSTWCCERCHLIAPTKYSRGMSWSLHGSPGSSKWASASAGIPCEASSAASGEVTLMVRRDLLAESSVFRS